MYIVQMYKMRNILKAGYKHNFCAHHIRPPYCPDVSSKKAIDDMWKSLLEALDKDVYKR